MQMDVGLDTGAMLLKAACPIEPTDTSASLYEKLAILGPEALLNALSELMAGTAQSTPQDHAMASYAAKLTKIEAQVNWQDSAAAIDRSIRAFTPWPGSHTAIANQIIKIHQAEPLQSNSDALPGTIIATSKQGIEVATGDGVIRLTQIQLPGKKPVVAADALNARAEWFVVGEQFSLAEFSS